MLSISTKDLSVNNEIRAVQVRVIDDSGAQLGVMKTRDALNIAIEKGFDLVEIAPTAQIPVCRIMDYGKYKFEKSKKEKETRKRQVIVETKEVQLSWSIDTHDFNTRINQTKKFIEAGNKIKVSLELARGREMAHIELGYKMLEKFEQACADFSVVEKKPLREGRRITMFIGPKKTDKRDSSDRKSPANTNNTNAVNENNELSETKNNTGHANTNNINNTDNVNNEVAETTNKAEEKVLN